MISIERIDADEMNHDGSDFGCQTNVFQTLPWLSYVAHTQNAEPVVAAVKSNGRILGHFTGLIISKYGVKILGSPFRGSGSYFMGFNLKPDAPRREVLQALPEFAFNRLRCRYLEIIDPCLTSNDWEGLPYNVEFLNWQKIDLNKSEDDLWANMKHSGRNNIRKAIKSGVIIEEATDVSFAEEYYRQLEEVLEKHGMAPPFRFERVRQLVECLLPTGNILLLRARNEKRFCIATGIFLFLNKTAVFWGAASLREYQFLRPNELLAWHGMKVLKNFGILDLHLGAECEQYKRKLGSASVLLPRLMKAKNAVLGGLLDFAKSPHGMRYRNWVLRKLDRPVATEHKA